MKNSTETREIENNEQTARKELENCRARSRRQRLENFEISKEIREFENKKHAARKELENFKTKSKPLERD